MIYPEVCFEKSLFDENLFGYLVDSTFFHGVKKIFHAAEDIKELIDPYVNFSFAGQQVSSKIVYTCSHPEFNQELRLGLKVNSQAELFS